MQQIEFNDQLKRIQDILKLPKEMRWMEDGFTIVPNNILTDNMPRELKLLYIILLMFAFKKGSCFPSVKILARIFGANERTIQRHIKKLKDEGWITVEYRKGKPSIYTLTKA